MKNKTLSLLALLASIVCIQAVSSVLDGKLDLGNLHNYSDQLIPGYVFSEETHDRDLTDEIATLGRVLFYDKQLSLNSELACAGCHKQEFAFGDTLVASPGFDEELTERHSTRLVNLNFSHLPEVFWDRRAGHLDSLPLMVLSNSIEMGFSGEHGQPDIDSLVRRVAGVYYYELLFELAYGDKKVTAEKMNLALTQFVRSIVSYDSKYDVGRSMVDSNTLDFPNFTALENQGKRLFQSPFSRELTHPMRTIIEGQNTQGVIHEEQIHPEWFSNLKGKMGCADCHGIDNFTTRKTSLTGNNGIISVFNKPMTQDTTVKRSPSLRDLINYNGIEIGPFMHDGSVPTLEKVMEHYADVGYPIKAHELAIHEKNPNLHTSLNVTAPNNIYTAPGNQGPGRPPDIIPHYLDPRIDQQETTALIAFLKTLTGKAIYKEEKWSDPFSEDGELTLTFICEPRVRIIEKTICEGDSFKDYHTSGLHSKRVCQPNDCDSTLIIDLTVTQAPELFYSHNLCDGNELFGYDVGIKTSYLKPANVGCDTIIHLDLTLVYPEFTDISETICQGKLYAGYSRPGTYIDTFSSIETGCDSTRRLSLTVTPHEKYPEEQVICQGETMYGHDTDGVHIDTIKDQSGCDYLRVLDLVVLERPQSYMSATICEDESFEGYQTSGLHTDVFMAENGCDSIRPLDLTVHPKTYSYHESEICEGEVFMGYEATGSYTNTTNNANGCDSLIFIELIVHRPTESFSEVAICEGESYEGYNQAGQYMDILTNAHGCDSMRSIRLDILEHTTSTYVVELCEGEEFEGYDTAGSYVDLMANVAGCDSTRHITIKTLSHSESYEAIHLCPGEQFEGRTEGNYDELYHNSVGCDSVRYVSIVNIAYDDAICTRAYDEEANEITNTAYIKAGPNPMVDFININIEKPSRLPAQLRIISSAHQLVSDQLITEANTRVELQDLEAGVYIVHIQHGLNVFLTRVVKINN